MRSGIARHAALLLFLAGACGAHAQLAPAPDAETGTLKRIRESGQIVIGYRRDALPFSYVDRRGEPVGYSIDLCREIVADVAASQDDADIHIVFQPVTTADQFARLTDGSIDLDCSATADTADRRRVVAFSPTIFVSGARLLVHQDSPIRAFHDLAGHSVVAIAGSTTAASLQHYLVTRKVDARLMTAPDAAQAFHLLATGGTDAFATNDVLQYSLIATVEGGRDFHVVGGLLTSSQYALAFRRDDPAFGAVVAESFARLAAQNMLTEFYNRWFIRRTPSGERMELPMSPLLQEVFRGLGEPG
jgi:glutamate/aspartate transport system substrate-binding protein